MKLKKEALRELVEKGVHEDFRFIDEDELGMDSHGAIKMLCVITDNKDNYGFYYDQTSEEWIFEDQELFKVKPDVQTVVVWNREDKKSHWN